MRKILNNNDKMKPLKYKEPNLKRKMIIVTLVFSVLLISGMCLYKAFAAFNEQKQFNVINGEVQDSGDIYFAYYVDDKITRDIPTQDSGYTLDTTKSTCTNGVTVGWDQTNWTALVNYQKYNATNNTRTKCDLYFKENKLKTASEYIVELASANTANLVTDDYGNTRYIGSNPDNYVSIDGENYTSDVYYGYYTETSTKYEEYSTLEDCQSKKSYCVLAHPKGSPVWRIIGVMKDIDDGNGNKSDRVKLMRDEKIGGFSWDTSDSSTNNGYGINEWSEADLMKLLNPGYESETVGGSLYWNSLAGTCYYGRNNGTKACDFTSTGIKDKMKSLIGDALWNVGATYSRSGLTTSKYYEEERGSYTGKNCTGSDACNVTRTTTWKGKVGLMYPSDYGYATGGGSTTDRKTCLNTSIVGWDEYSNCYRNNWLFKDVPWTLTAVSNSISVVQYIESDGVIYTDKNAGDTNLVFPVVYLDSSVRIESGTGTQDDPFVLNK